MRNRTLAADLVLIWLATVPTAGALMASPAPDPGPDSPPLGAEVATCGTSAEPVYLASPDDRGCCLLRTARPFKSGNRCSDNTRRDACARAARAAGLSTADWDHYKDTRCKDVNACPD